MKQENLELDVSQPQSKNTKTLQTTESCELNEVASEVLSEGVKASPSLKDKLVSLHHKYNFTSSKSLFLTILLTSVLAIIFGLFQHDQTSDYLIQSQKIRDVVAAQPPSTSKDAQVETAEIKQHLLAIQAAISASLIHPMAESNFSSVLTDITKLVNKMDVLIAQAEQYKQRQEIVLSSLKQIDESKNNYRKAIEPTLERMRSYKNEAKFEQLTANANQTDLFNALNYKQAEEKLENLQLAADRLLQNYESIFYAQTVQELNALITSYPSSAQHFKQVVHDFADIPTKMALKTWQKNNIDTLDDITNLADKLTARLDFANQLEKLKQQSDLIVEQTKLIENRLTVHLINKTQVQPSSNFALWLVLVLALIGLYKYQLTNTLNKLLEKIPKQVEKTAK
ncbi:hypothetical protein [Catenovulum agarivorans]|uniref:hypothetical protein n=1 Tax=Catenovulum agarivorans TaxID=1172192 RepID=UPI00030DC6E3|nr:hypothetical protein [Catenovulum agarivorans]